MLIKKAGKWVTAISILCALALGCSKSSKSNSDTTTPTTTKDKDTAADDADDADDAADTNDDNTVENTIISIVGSLALTGSSSSGSSLALADSNSLDQYWLKCVTIDLTNSNACIDQLDTDGSFELECDGFKGKPFGCFILQGSTESGLTLKGMLSSADLVIGATSASAALAINFDLSTGSATIDSFSQASEAGEEVVADAVVPEEVASLSLTSGTYGFCFKDLNNFNEAGKAGKVDLKFNQCPGHTEQLYMNFMSSTDTGALPSLELWNSEAAYNGCFPSAADEPTYEISDGTSATAYSFTEATVDFETLFDKIFAWMPQASQDSYNASLTDGAKEENDMLSGLEEYYGSGKACTGFVDDLLAAYDAASLTKTKGRMDCSGYEFMTGAAEGKATSSTLNTQLGQSGAPIQW